MPEKRIDTSLAAGRAVQLESFGGPPSFWLSERYLHRRPVPATSVYV